ncbi:MAG: hypothetical protein ACRDLT_06830 [Solirubrobacteraceae bacterium]
MNSDFFTQLEVELGSLTRDGVHLLDASSRARHHHLFTVVRHGAVIVALAIALAASLVSEFPATASGHTPAALAAAAHRA